MLFLLKGQIAMIYGDKRFEIVEPGTCIYIDASIPHRADSLDNMEAKLLVVVSRTTESEFDPELSSGKADR
jgi:uncharacterized RmlC-like cupin family protein